MSSDSLPVIAEDGSRLDWVRAKYEADIELEYSEAVVAHRIHEAGEIQHLLDEGRAKYVIEVRCPHTLLSRQHESSQPKQEVTWHDDTVSGDVYLTPGIVLKNDTEIDTANLNRAIWQDGTTVKVTAGWWLARGEMRSVTPLAASLVKFQRDNDNRLGSGQMSVTEAADAGTPYFRVVMAQELYDKRIKCRDMQIAGLIAACGMLPISSLRKGEANADSPIASQLRSRFKKEDIPDWDDEEFDPARAATVLEEFYIPAEGYDK